MPGAPSPTWGNAGCCFQSFPTASQEQPSSHLHIPRALTPQCCWQRGCCGHHCQPPCAVPSQPHFCPGSSAWVTRRWMVPVIAPVLPRGGVTVIYGTICGGLWCAPGEQPRRAVGRRGDTAILGTLPGTARPQGWV